MKNGDCSLLVVAMSISQIMVGNAEMRQASQLVAVVR